MTIRTPICDLLGIEHLDIDCMPCGQGAGGIRDAKPCAEIVRDIVIQAGAVLDALPRPATVAAPRAARGG